MLTSYRTGKYLPLAEGLFCGTLAPDDNRIVLVL